MLFENHVEDNSETPALTINLEKYCEPTQVKEKAKKRENQFEIVPNEESPKKDLKKAKFSAKTSEDLQKWMDAIKTAMREKEVPPAQKLEHVTKTRAKPMGANRRGGRRPPSRAHLKEKLKLAPSGFETETTTFDQPLENLKIQTTSNSNLSPSNKRANSQYKATSNEILKSELSDTDSPNARRKKRGHIPKVAVRPPSQGASIKLILPRPGSEIMKIDNSPKNNNSNSPYKKQSPIPPPIENKSKFSSTEKINFDENEEIPSCEGDTEDQQSNDETSKEDNFASPSKSLPPPLPSSALKPQLDSETNDSAESSSEEEDCDSVEHFVEEEVEVENESLEGLEVNNDSGVLTESIEKDADSNDTFEQNFNENNSNMKLGTGMKSNQKSKSLSAEESLSHQMTELQAALDLLDYNIKGFSSDENET